MRHRLLYAIIFIAIGFVVLYSPMTSYLVRDLVTYKLEKALDMDIVFGRVRIKPPAQLTVSDIKAMDKAGMAMVSERAYLRLDPRKVFAGRFVLSCDFQNVMLKSKICDTLNGLLRPFDVPVQNGFRFDGIKGIINIGKGDLAISDIDGSGPDFKFSGSFKRYRDKKIEYELDFRINPKIVESAEGQAVSLLTDRDKDGWYSIKLSLKGDPRNPSSISFSTGGVKLEVKPGGN